MLNWLRELVYPRTRRYVGRHRTPSHRTIGHWARQRQPRDTQILGRWTAAHRVPQQRVRAIVRVFPPDR